jgi:hypothetical protein
VVEAQAGKTDKKIAEEGEQFVALNESLSRFLMVLCGSSYVWINVVIGASTLLRMTSSWKRDKWLLDYARFKVVEAQAGKTDKKIAEEGEQFVAFGDFLVGLAGLGFDHFESRIVQEPFVALPHGSLSRKSPKRESNLWP